MQRAQCVQLNVHTDFMNKHVNTWLKNNCCEVAKAPLQWPTPLHGVAKMKNGELIDARPTRNLKHTINPGLKSTDNFEIPIIKDLLEKLIQRNQKPGCFCQTLILNTHTSK